MYRPLQTYMLMIGAPVGDLVQFVKTGAAGSRGNGKRGASAKEARAAADDVLVSRVELDCRTYHHKKHWEETILPRLYAFARMVYRFRGDDLLRWRYLLAAPVRSPLSGMNYCCGVLVSRAEFRSSTVVPFWDVLNETAAKCRFVDDEELAVATVCVLFAVVCCCSKSKGSSCGVGASLAFDADAAKFMLGEPHHCCA